MQGMSLSMRLGKSESFNPLINLSNLADLNRRHLLRLWLRDPNLAWGTPGPLKDRWDTLYKDVTEEEQVFPLEPKIRGGAGKV
jgi:hypothetical protein